MKDPHTFFILYLMDAKKELILQLSIFSWATEFSIFYSNDRMVAGKMSTPSLVNPLHPNISMHILHTVLYTFPKRLARRICLTIKSCLSW